MKTLVVMLIAVWLLTGIVLDPESTAELVIPAVSAGAPGAGKRVRITPPEYQESDVHHVIYLPEGWKPDGPKLPIIFEYTGNYWPATGSSGKVEDAALGYGLSAGKFIWVSLPFVDKDAKRNALTWWGDIEATIEYAKLNVPRTIEQFNAHPDGVILAGFSRGAIAVNFIGLHDEEISKLWTAFVAHDHFDGVREWPAPWGKPLAQYRAEALERLKRVGRRPYLVSQNGNIIPTKSYLENSGIDLGHFKFSRVDTREILGPFPNKYAQHPHNDIWLTLPSPYRVTTWKWINQVRSLTAD